MKYVKCIVKYTSKSVLNPDSDVTNLTYVFDLIYVSRDLDLQSMAVDMTN